jgi:hypothetical protein
MRGSPKPGSSQRSQFDAPDKTTSNGSIFGAHSGNSLLDKLHQFVSSSKNETDDSTEKIEAKKFLREYGDMTAKLQEWGLLEEYQKERHNYQKMRNWHKHKVEGDDLSELDAGVLRGDVTSIQAHAFQDWATKEKRCKSFKLWYTDMSEWQWQKTCTYWVSATFFIGSVFFAMSSFAGCFPSLSHEPFKHIVEYLSWIGNCYFTCGMYLLLLSVTNFNRHGDFGINVTGFDFNPLAYGRVCERLKHNEVGRNSYHICLAYLVGVVFYNIMTLVPVVKRLANIAGLTFPAWFHAIAMSIDLPGIVAVTLVISNILGGLSFWGAGCLEMLENRVWVYPFEAVKSLRNISSRRSEPPASSSNPSYEESLLSPKEEELPEFLAQIASILNMIGGLLFFVPPVIEQITKFLPIYHDESEAEWWSSMLFGIGSCCYIVASYLSVVMWQNNQLGLTFMAKLNVDHEKDREEVAKLPFITIIMVVVCCFACVATLTDFVLTFSEIVRNHESLIQSCLHVCRAFIPFLLSKMMLTLISAQPQLPDHQPYRKLFITARLLVFGLLFIILHNLMHSVHEILRGRDPHRCQESFDACMVGHE